MNLLSPIYRNHNIWPSSAQKSSNTSELVPTILPSSTHVRPMSSLGQLFSQTNLKKRKKISPTRLSIGFWTNLSLVGLIFLFIIRGLNLTTDDIIPAHINRLNWNTPLPRTAFLWTKTLYKSLKFLFCIHKVVRRILTIRCWPADCYKLYSLI